MDLSTDLDLELAWKRNKADLKDMTFSDHPFEAEIIDNNFDEWIDELRKKLKDYRPSRCRISNIPKKGFHLRPGAILNPEDATVFQALILHEIHSIRKSLLWSASKERFAYILKEDQSETNWFVHEYKGWSDFRKRSLQYIDEGYKWVVFADISAYFENISIQRLISDLKSFGASKEIIGCLSKCLNRWAEPRARGIPQGNRPSFILGEIYLDSVDKRLKNRGIRFCRYVDDIRLFFKQKKDAISGLHILTILLREKELNLQTAKSFILYDEDARNEIDSISAVINDLEEDVKTELRRIIEKEVPYATPSIISTILSEHEDTIKLESVRKAFDKFLEHEKSDFNKTLFHYCINRLGAAEDDYAVNYCLKCIISRPEEFIYILPYFSKLKERRIPLAEEMIYLFKDEPIVFNRHFFLLTRWTYKENIHSEKIIALCRDLAFDSSVSVDDYTKHYAWAILGKYGDLADLDSIEAEYSSEIGEPSKSTIICSIRRMVEDRRNSIYARASGDGVMVNYAIKTAKKLIG
jgi:hypothetical protein